MALRGKIRWMADKTDLLAVNKDKQYRVSRTCSLSIALCHHKAL